MEIVFVDVVYRRLTTALTIKMGDWELELIPIFGKSDGAATKMLERGICGNERETEIVPQCSRPVEDDIFDFHPTTQSLNNVF